MAMVELDWELALPNEYCIDHSFSQGKTRTCTYDGPDKLFLIIDNDTGKQGAGPITQMEKNDGRPLPLNCRYVEVDCIANPLIGQLIGPVIDEAEEDYTSDVMPPGVIEVPGYRTFTYQTPLVARDIWDRESLHVDENDNITFQVRSTDWAIFGTEIDRELTWDDLRAKRATFLKNSDAEVTDDMPQSLKDKFTVYRQRLRDWPNVMQAAGIPVKFAYKMEPIDPASETPPDTEGSIIL